jgi:hypothetical protein
MKSSWFFLVLLTPFGHLAAATVVANLLGTSPTTIPNPVANSFWLGDRTDPENNGAADADVNYNAVFSANNKAFFGAPEGSFNIFDNRRGGGNDKWCCDPVQSGGSWVQADFPNSFTLTSFTVSSSNDTPARDPIHWAMQAFNFGSGTWVDVYRENVGATAWSGRNQTRFFISQMLVGTPDFQATFATSRYRYIAFQAGSAAHALGELEIFGIPEPSKSLLLLSGLLSCCLIRRRKIS